MDISYSSSPSSSSMACIKVVNRSASVALSPEAPYLAAGTMAGAVDLSFSSSANLEIFKLDFQSVDRELALVGESPSSERFNRLAWGKNGSGSEDLSLGLIAGGLVDGSIDIWNPLTLIHSQTSESAVVGHLSRHKGPVRGLEFNCISPNLLASGADDGEICIWDLVKPAEPSYFPPLKGSGSAAQVEISYLSWNSKVQHILASTSYNGTTVVWDLKKQKPVISFADSVRRRCSVMQWNPDMATQLIVASDEDGSPSLRLWDMRNVVSPVKEFVGHTKGVIAMAWCPTDSSYLLTCAKDNRTICWDTGTAEVVCELPAGTNWNFDVHWYPRIPGVISASSFDGKIGMYNIEGCSRQGAGENYFAAAPLRAPKWYKRPVGASFGFGGKLVSFHSRPSSGNASAASEVLVHNLVMEDSLVTRSSDFEAAIENGERSLLKALCDTKSQKSASEEERETWGFLKVMFEEDGTARTKLLTHLGFRIPTGEKDRIQDYHASGVGAMKLEDTVADNQVDHESFKRAAIYAVVNGEDFFNNLPSPRTSSPLSTSANNSVTADSTATAEDMRQQPDELNENADSEFEDAIQRALVVGDYKGAVSHCIATNRMADALVIAHVGGGSLWESTRDQYLKMSHASYMKIVSAMVKNDLTSLVNSRPLRFWKDTLGLLCTFAEKEEWTALCDMLASKLLTAGNALAATLCYICAGNIGKTVEIWSGSLTTEHDRKSHLNLLQDLMEKTIVLALATRQRQFSASVCKLVENYAEILASQGLLTVAMNCLKLLGSDDLSPELAILRDRIALSTQPEKETRSMALDNSQLQSSHLYYQETAPAQMQPNVAGSPSSDNYQQQFNASYGAGFTPPTSYPPAQQPTMFTPNQAQQVPQVSQPSFTPVPQPSVRTAFVPSTTPQLTNAEQYRQPSLGLQLYPGSTIPSYPAPAGSLPHGPIASQFGQVPAPKMPQVVAPTPTPTEFIPATYSGVAQRPGLGSTQPPSPAQPASVQPTTTPVAPLPTVQTADTSKVPAKQKHIITALTILYNETSEALGGSRANPAKKREIEDNSRKVGALFAKLNGGDLSKNVADKLSQLCQALNNNDFSRAIQIQMQLTNSDWDECNFWLATLKRMIKTRQNLRGS